MKVQGSSRITIIAIVLLSFIAGSCTDNWPQFRGAGSNMLTDATDLPMEWGNEENISWKHPVKGNGWSSPITWGDKIFYTAAILDKSTVKPDTAADPDKVVVNPQDAIYRWMVYCLDIESGKLLWESVAYEGKPGIKTHNGNTYASETPVTDGRRIYAYFGMTGIYCFDLDGNRIWEKNLGAYKTRGDWGTSSSPVLFGNILYLQVDNQEESFLVALNKKTGDEIWRVSREEETNWSTPVIWKNQKRTELVTGGVKARSYNLKNGELYWEIDLGGGRNTTSAVADRDMLYLGNEPRRGDGGILFAVKAGAEGDITPDEGDSTSAGVLWTRPNSNLNMASPLLYEGYIYNIGRRTGNISCIDATTGELIYSKTKIPDANGFWASPWAYDGKIFCLDDQGATHVIKAGKDFQLISTNRIDETTWASVAIARNSIIIRGVNNVYCIK